MISMVDKQSILHRYRVDCDSKRKISRDLHLSRKTVDKIIREYESALGSDSPEASVEQVFLTPPRYDSRSRRSRVFTDSVKELIAKQLDANKAKRKSGLRKQCMLKRDIYELLINNGHRISYPSVCNYIRSIEHEERERRHHPAFIRQHYAAGDLCEFDWGEVTLKIKGVSKRFYIAIFTLAHSNARYAYLFHHQNTLAFMESHRNFFADTRGVPHMMVYDNMRVAIKKFVGHEKHPTDALMRMSNFYCFAFRFCNIRAGWEKGHVERSVEVLRRKAFSLSNEFESLAEANIHLSNICDRLNDYRRESVEADLEALQPHVNKIGCFEMACYKVDKWSTICMSNVHYSVPDVYVGKTLAVKIYSEKIVIFDGENKVAAHERSYRGGEWKITFEHYLRTLSFKPGAVSSSVALSQMSCNMKELYDRHFASDPRSFVLLILYARENEFDNDSIIKAYEDAKCRGIKRPSIDQIKVLMHSKGEDRYIAKEEASPSAEQMQIESGAIGTLRDLSTMMGSAGVGITI